MQSPKKSSFGLPTKDKTVLLDYDCLDVDIAMWSQHQIRTWWSAKVRWLSLFKYICYDICNIFVNRAEVEYCITNRRYFDIARGLHENCKYPHHPDEKLKKYLLKNYNDAVQQEDESDDDLVAKVEISKRKRGPRSVPQAPLLPASEVNSSRATTKPSTNITASSKKTAEKKTHQRQTSLLL